MNRLRSLTFALAAALLLALPAGAAALAPSDLDTTFGNAGVVDPNFQADQTALAVQADGKILIAHEAPAGPPIVIRLTANGAVDPTFGAGGSVTLAALGATNHEVARVLIAADGTIYVVGTGLSGTERGMIWALTPAGAPETAFGGIGAAIYPAVGTSSSGFVDAAFTPDGRIATVAGTTVGGDGQLHLRVINTAGAIGVSGSFGIATVDFEPSSVAVQPSGRAVVGFIASGSGQIVSGIAGFTAAGAADVTFGNAPSGFQYFGLIGVPVMSTVYRVLVGAGGVILGTGHVGYTATLGKYTVDGLPDTALGQFGMTRSLPLGISISYSVDAALAGGGRIVTVGAGASDSLPSKPVGFFIRYDASGRVDETFGPGGIGAAAPSGFYPTDIAVQPDGKYIALAVGASDAFRVIRLWGDHPLPQPAVAAFAKSLKSKLKASKAKKFRGSASGTDLSKVEIAIQKVDSRLLKKSKKCAYVKSSKGRLKNFKAAGGKCAPGVWLTAKGTTKWSYSLSRSLPPGKYVFSARSSGFLGLGAVATKRVTLTK